MCRLLDGLWFWEISTLEMQKRYNTLVVLFVIEFLTTGKSLISDRNIMQLLQPKF